MGVIIAAVALTAAVVFYVLHPVITGRSAPLDRRPDEPSEIEARKRVALLALRDVEYDYATGKLDDGDYSLLRGELATEALEAMRAEEARVAGMDRHDHGPADTGVPLPDREDIEAEIARYRAALQAGTACPECRRVNDPGSRFCATCGVSLAMAPAVSGGATDGS